MSARADIGPLLCPLGRACRTGTTPRRRARRSRRASGRTSPRARRAASSWAQIVDAARLAQQQRRERARRRAPRPSANRLVRRLGHRLEPLGERARARPGRAPTARSRAPPAAARRVAAARMSPASREAHLVHDVVELVAGQRADRRARGRGPRAGRRRGAACARARAARGSATGRRRCRARRRSGRASGGAMSHHIRDKLTRSMLSTVLRTIRTHALVAPGDRVIVAVSGGPDSMALLHALWEARDRLGLTLEVATVDHGLRPEARAEGWRWSVRAPRRSGCRGTRLAVDVAARASAVPRGRTPRAACASARSRRSRRERGARGSRSATRPTIRPRQCCSAIVRGTGLPGLSGIPYRARAVHPPAARRPRAGGASLPRAAEHPVRRGSLERRPALRARARSPSLPAAARRGEPARREALVALAAAARGAPAARRRDRDAAAAGAPPRSAGCARAAGRPRSICGRAASSRSPTVKSAIRPRDAGRAAAARAAELLIPGPGAYRWAAGTLDVREAAAGRGGRAGVGGSAEFDADGSTGRSRCGPAARATACVRAAAAAAASSPTCSSTPRSPRAARDALPVLTTADDVVLFVPGLRSGGGARPDGDTRRLVRLRFDVDRRYMSARSPRHSRDIKGVFDPHRFGGNTFQVRPTSAVVSGAEPERTSSAPKS